MVIRSGTSTMDGSTIFKRTFEGFFNGGSNFADTVSVPPSASFRAEGVRTRFAGSKTMTSAVKVRDTGAGTVTVIVVTPIPTALNSSVFDAPVRVNDSGTSRTPAALEANVT